MEKEKNDILHVVAKLFVVVGDSTGTLVKMRIESEWNDLVIKLPEMMNKTIKFIIENEIYYGAILQFYGDRQRLTLVIELRENSASILKYHMNYASIKIMQSGENNIRYAGIAYIDYINGLVKRIAKATGNQVRVMESMVYSETGVDFKNQRRWLVREADVVKEYLIKIGKEYGLQLDDRITNDYYFLKRYNEKKCIICELPAKEYFGIMGLCEKHAKEYKEIGDKKFKEKYYL